MEGTEAGAQVAVAGKGSSQSGKLVETEAVMEVGKGKEDAVSMEAE